MDITEQIQYEDTEKQQDIEIPREVRNLTTQAYNKNENTLVVHTLRLISQSYELFQIAVTR